MLDADRGKDPQFQIARCDPLSIASAVLTVARSGLSLGSEIYLIPYKGRLTAQTGYLGEVRRIRESTGGRAIVRCAIIRAGDDFENDFAADIPIRHRRNLEADFQRGAEAREKVGAWACVIESGRWHTPAIMSRAELEQHAEQYSKAPAHLSIWKKDPDSAWLKTVIRRAAKLVRGDLVRDEDEDQKAAELELNERLSRPARPPHGPEAAYEAVAVATAVYDGQEQQEEENT
ncbi:MAG: recombinase RecT [Acidobacteria bacterium]|nr:recombinase RecT [Acidobacteriota bacterium]